MRLELHRVALVESQRTARSGRGFSLLRIAPLGWLALEEEMRCLEALVSARLRGTDFVTRVRDCEVGVVLIETVDGEVAAPLQRVREAAVAHFPKLDLRFGWASVGPRQGNTWQEAWRWAGEVLLGDGARAAA